VSPERLSRGGAQRAVRVRNRSQCAAVVLTTASSAFPIVLRSVLVILFAIQSDAVRAAKLLSDDKAAPAPMCSMCRCELVSK
jgi:hypothetical protein